MKTSVVGIVAVAVLLVVTGIGFGIAQAGGTHAERPVMEAVESGSSTTAHVEPGPISNVDGQGLEETEIARRDDMQLEGARETGTIPGTDFVEPAWVRDWGETD